MEESDESEPHLHRMLRAEMKRRGLNQHSLAAAAGLKPDAIRDIFRSKSSSPRMPTLRALADYLGLTFGQLLGIDDDGSRVNFGMADRPTALPSIPEHTPRNLPGVPEIDGLGGAGSGSDGLIEAFTMGATDIISADAVKDYWGLPDTYLKGELGVQREWVRILEIKGDSMFPTLQSTDRAMINLRDRNLSQPGIFAFFDGYGVGVKRFEIVHGADVPSLRVISDNPIHAPYVMTAEEAHIIGRVFWVARRM